MHSAGFLDEVLILWDGQERCAARGQSFWVRRVAREASVRDDPLEGVL